MIDWLDISEKDHFKFSSLPYKDKFYLRVKSRKTIVLKENAAKCIVDHLMEVSP